jgi:hypothetical protein
MRRTWKKIALFASLSLLLMSGAALAHPNHKILGTITKVASDQVIVKDRQGKLHTIKLAKTTKVTRNNQAMKADEIAIGSRVVVTAVSDEDMTAKTIEVGVVVPPGGRN